MSTSLDLSPLSFALRSMMRRASIAAVEGHDAFGCILTRWLRYSRADKAGNRTVLAGAFFSFCACWTFFLRSVSHAHRTRQKLKINKYARGGGGPAADL